MPMPSTDRCSESQEAELHLPLIDLSSVDPSEPERPHPHLECLLRQIREACEEWGFFRVINHGVGREVVQKMDQTARGLFALPEEVKERAASTKRFTGYEGPAAERPFLENMTFPRTLHSDSVRQYSDKLWPQGNPEFCEAVEAYSCILTDLATMLMKLILLSLGPEIYNLYYKSVFQRREGYLRMNHYLPCEEPSPVVSLFAHKDISCITLLYQDHAGGLEVASRQGQWLSVKPEPAVDSFVVNIGDSLKRWCNDRYRSAEHRVVYGGWKSRLSLAFFWHFSEDEEIRSPPQLIDGQHPARYRPIRFKEYRDSKARAGLYFEPP